MSKSRRPKAKSKAPKKRDTIPVQAEWLEIDSAPPAPTSSLEGASARGSRASARPRVRKGPLAPPPLPGDFSAKVQGELQRLQALHPARDNDRLLGELHAALKEIVSAGFVKITTRQGNIALAVVAEAVFVPGGATVRPAGRDALAQVAASLSERVERLRVEGHVSAAADAEWRLGALRVLEVANRLAAGGVAPARVAAAVFGELGEQAALQPREILVTIVRGSGSGPR